MPPTRTVHTALGVEQPIRASAVALVRETYPAAVMSARHVPTGARVWYTFPDGSAVPNVDGVSS